MKRKFLIVLWIAAIAWLVLCLYLSWQTGEETAVGISWKLAQWCAKLLHIADVQAFHMQLRLLAHFGIFFVSGVLFGGAFAATLHHNRSACLASAVVCSVFAVLAEVCKVGIPGRHLQWDETGLNVIGAITGILLVQVLYRSLQKKLKS